jgi:hypothetical protein
MIEMLGIRACAFSPMRVLTGVCANGQLLSSIQLDAIRFHFSQPCIHEWT